MLHRIHIFGASGSGTSTLARAICTQYGYFRMDTDDYFWLPTDPRFTRKRPAEQRLAMMRADLDAHPKAVISGSLCGWGDALIPYFDLAVRIVTDTKTRIQRIRERESARFGDRILPGGDMYAQHQAFLAWASAYDTGGPDMRSRAMHDNWATLLNCPVITVDGTEPIGNLLLLLRPYCSETD